MTAKISFNRDVAMRSAIALRQAGSKATAATKTCITPSYTLANSVPGPSRARKPVQSRARVTIVAASAAETPVEEISQVPARSQAGVFNFSYVQKFFQDALLLIQVSTCIFNSICQERNPPFGFPNHFRPILLFVYLAVNPSPALFSPLQRLFELLQRVRIAAAALQASVDSRAASSQHKEPSAGPATGAPSVSLPQRLATGISAATFGAVAHLRQTLTDASGTMDVKWRAMESTVGEGVSKLFSATRASAELQSAFAEGAPVGAARKVAEQHNAAVMQSEEALREQVFAQVYAELCAQARQRGSQDIGYSPA